MGPAACDGSVNRQHQHQDASRHCGQESGHQQDHQTNSNSTEDIPLLRRLLHRELPRPVGVAVIYLPWRIQRGQICVELPVPDHSKVCSRLLLHRILHGLPDLQHSGPSGCQEMEPVVRLALASCLHSPFNFGQIFLLFLMMTVMSALRHMQKVFFVLGLNRPAGSDVETSETSNNSTDLPPKYEDVTESPPKYEEATRQ